MTFLILFLFAETLKQQVDLYQNNRKVATLIKGKEIGSILSQGQLQVSLVVSKSKDAKIPPFPEKGSSIYNDSNEFLGLLTNKVEVTPTYSPKYETDFPAYFLLEGSLNLKSEEAFDTERSERLSLIKLLKQGKKSFSEYKGFIDKFKLAEYDTEGFPTFKGYSHTYYWPADENEIRLIMVFSPDNRLLFVYNFFELDPSLKASQAFLNEDDKLTIKNFKYKTDEREGLPIYLIDYNPKNKKDANALRDFLQTSVEP